MLRSAVRSWRRSRSSIRDLRFRLGDFCIALFLLAAMTRIIETGACRFKKNGRGKFHIETPASGTKKRRDSDPEIFRFPRPGGFSAGKVALARKAHTLNVKFSSRR